MSVLSMKSVMPTLACCLLCLGSIGCRTAPFAPTPPVAVAHWNPEEVRTEYAARLAPAFEQRHAVTFALPFMRMSALGIVVAKRADRSFSLAGLTHTGITLFIIEGRGDTVQTRFIPPELADRPEIVAAIGADARRVFFDLVPSAEAKSRRRRTRLTFSEQKGETRVEYDFGGKDGVLTEKRIYRGWRRLATVGYYEYRRDPQTGYLTPGGIVLRNRQYKYTLILRQLNSDS